VAGAQVLSMRIESQHEGARGLAFETSDIATMQGPSPGRGANISMTLALACLVSEASASVSIFTGKQRDTESGNDYFGATKPARQVLREEPSKRLGGTGGRGWAD
jgi:hypothetical protein